MNFFDHFDRFYRTSISGVLPERLNKRHEVTIERHRDLLHGKRVLDIGSHDGRFSFAALQAGCAHITGIEARPHLIDAAEANFRRYGADPSRYRFYLGDVFDIMRREKIEADVVLLLGFFYHTSRHAELASLISRTGAEYIILDSIVLPQTYVPNGVAMVEIAEEPSDVQGFGFESGPSALVGVPSHTAVKLIFHHHGYLTEEIDWTPYLQGTLSVEEYRKGTRATFINSRASRGSGGHAARRRARCREPLMIPSDPWHSLRSIATVSPLGQSRIWNSYLCGYFAQHDERYAKVVDESVNRRFVAKERIGVDLIAVNAASFPNRPDEWRPHLARASLATGVCSEAHARCGFL
jgi:hypothetical protein